VNLKKILNWFHVHNDKVIQHGLERDRQKFGWTMEEQGTLLRCLGKTRYERVINSDIWESQSGFDIVIFNFSMVLTVILSIILGVMDIEYGGYVIGFFILSSVMAAATLYFWGSNYDLEHIFLSFLFPLFSISIFPHFDVLKIMGFMGGIYVISMILQVILQYLLLSGIWGTLKTIYWMVKNPGEFKTRWLNISDKKRSILVAATILAISTIGISLTLNEQRVLRWFETVASVTVGLFFGLLVPFAIYNVIKNRKSTR
jgi:hypothetical protein